MAANTTIGKLNVILTGSAKELESVITGAERRLAGFAAKATAPFTSLTSSVGKLAGLGGLAGAMFGGPVTGTAMALGGTALTQALGLGDHGAGLERALQKYRDLNEQTGKFGISPEFYRGFQLALGPQADMAESLLTKFEKFRASNPEVLRGTTSLEDAFKRVAKAAQEMNDPMERSKLLFDAFGKSGLEAGDALEAGAMDKAMGRAAGLVDPRAAAGAANILKLRKEAKLVEEAYDNLSMAFQEPMEKAAMQWQRGGITNLSEALDNVLESYGRRLFFAIGMLDKDDLLNMVGDGGPAPGLSFADTVEIFKGRAAKIEQDAKDFLGEMGKTKDPVVDFRKKLLDAGASLDALRRFDAGVDTFKRHQLANAVRSPFANFQNEMLSLVMGPGSADDKAKRAAMLFQGLGPVTGPSAAASLIQAGSQQEYALMDQAAISGQVGPRDVAAALAALADADREGNANAVKLGQAILQAIQNLGAQAGRGGGLQAQ